MNLTREQRQQLFYQICKDSGYKLSATEACELTAAVAKTHPITIWADFASFSMLEKIASGTQKMTKDKQ